VKEKGNLVKKMLATLHAGAFVLGEAARACVCVCVCVVDKVSTVVDKPVCVIRDIFLGRRYLCKSESQRRVGFKCNIWRP
jgi:hypothetical protein